MYRNNLQCSLCKDMSSIENEEHLLVCPVLTNHPSLKEDIKTVKYDDVFSDINKQQRAVKVFKEIMKIYEYTMNKNQ